MHQESQNKILPDRAIVSPNTVVKSNALQLKDNRTKIPARYTFQKTGEPASVLQMKFKRRDDPSVEYTAETPEEEFLALAEFLHEDDPEYGEFKITVQQIVTVLKEIATEEEPKELADYEIRDEVMSKCRQSSSSSSVTAAAGSIVKTATESYDDDDDAHPRIPQIRKLSEKISDEDASAMHQGKQKGLTQWLAYVHDRNNPDLVTDRKRNFYVRLHISKAKAQELFEQGMHVIASGSGYFGFVCSI